MATPSSPYSSSRRSPSHGEDDSMIGPFKKLENIGKGSFALVYRGIHVKRRSLVAIKSVQLFKLNRKLKENLTSEIHILRSLQHPHIVSLIDCQESPQYMNIVMEFCELGDLSAFIKKRASLASHPATAGMMEKYPNPQEGGLNEVIVRHFTKQIASALEFLHSKNYIHRDLKPQNLLLNPSPLFYAKHKPDTMPFAPAENSLIPAAGIDSLPMLKVADFGFARFLPQTSLAETLCGSPLYMAPEILRYEKYDAKADLWSVGAVVHEMMVAKPPFRASNHVELLRRIEKQDDRIKFPEGLIISSAMKHLIRSLLRRKPVERMGFEAFFDDAVIRSDIPGLVGEDRPKISDSDHSLPVQREQRISSKSEQKQPVRHTTSSSYVPQEAPRHPSLDSGGSRLPQERLVVGSAPAGRPALRQTATTQPSARRLSHTPILEAEEQAVVRRGSRPAMTSHPTAPARPTGATALPMERRSSRNSPSPKSSVLKDHFEAQRTPYRVEDRAEQESKDRTDHDIAFEREYVVVEKRSVEVNALADDILAANSGGRANPQNAMVRRATTQGSPTSVTGAHVHPSRAIQIAQNKQRPEPLHQRTGSYERRYGRIPGSVSSAISNALHAVALRSGVSLSPPMGLGKGPSPPQGYAGFPTYPTAQSSMLMIGDGGQVQETKDEESKLLKEIEALAHRSDCVYWFADVKHQQLLPARPSDEAAGGVPKSPTEADDDDLTPDATMAIAEESLVLYVKAVSILSKSLDLAGAWWNRRMRGDGRLSPSTTSQVAMRMSSVVQFLRKRFNECIDNAEFAARKLVEAQRSLPIDHHHHPNNRSEESGSSTNVGSAENIYLPSGITAEKLMYDRAIDMSRTAAVNELVGEDLPGCERNYMTAIQLLQAILDTEDDSSSRSTQAARKGNTNEETVDGLELEDRESIQKLIENMKSRVKTLRKKIEIQKAQRRASVTSGGTARRSNGSSPSTTSGTATPSAR